MADSRRFIEELHRAWRDEKGAALTYAAPMGEVVSALVAYYPETTRVANMRDFVGHFQVPILAM